MARILVGTEWVPDRWPVAAASQHSITRRTVHGIRHRRPPRRRQQECCHDNANKRHLSEVPPAFPFTHVPPRLLPMGSVVALTNPLHRSIRRCAVVVVSAAVREPCGSLKSRELPGGRQAYRLLVILGEPCPHRARHGRGGVCSIHLPLRRVDAVRWPSRNISPEASCGPATSVTWEMPDPSLLAALGGRTDRAPCLGAGGQGSPGRGGLASQRPEARGPAGCGRASRPAQARDLESGWWRPCRISSFHRVQNHAHRTTRSRPLRAVRTCGRQNRSAA